MSWYESTDEEVDSLALHDAQYRLWLSVIVLALREYQTLHRLGYLDNGNIVREKCARLGRSTNTRTGPLKRCMRVISISSITDVVELLEFLKGGSLSILMRYLNVTEVTENIIINGLKKIEAGETPTILSYEPDAIDRSIRLFRPGCRKKPCNTVSDM